MYVKQRTREMSEITSLAEIDVTCVLHALADPVRLDMVRQLAECTTGALRCGQLSMPVTKSTASHHIKTLVHAGIVAERAEGTCKNLSLRKDELDQRFPGLLDSVLRSTTAP